MTEQEEMRRILATPKRPSLRELVEEHGLICGEDGEIYFGKEAEEKVRKSFRADREFNRRQNQRI